MGDRATTSTCDGPDCDRPVFRYVLACGRPLCESHMKQLQRAGNARALTPLRPELTDEQKLLEAALAWVESPDNDDAEYERRRRTVVAAALRYAARRRVRSAPLPLTQLVSIERRLQAARRERRRVAAVGRRYLAVAGSFEQLAARAEANFPKGGEHVA